MIEVEHLSKSFGPVRAVRDISFRVEQGEILGLLGPNGAGKTTTMRLMTGYYPPSSGDARIGGVSVLGDPIAVRRKIGYLPENVPLYPEMTVSGFLRFVADAKGIGRSKRNRAVARVMSDCHLEAVQDRRIKFLSKGYRQRTGLAQALLGDPEVLILDEPTIGLDPRQINEIRALIKGFAGDKTVILSTHILPEVSMTCQRVVIVNQGRVMAEDRPGNLQAQLAGANRIRMRIGGPVEGIRLRLSGLSSVTSVTYREVENDFIAETVGEGRPALAREICEAGWDLFELTPLTASLEDVFLHLVTTESEVVDA